jgi:hypothetical protein
MCLSKSQVIEKTTCAVDRMAVKDAGDLNLHESATCVRKLDGNASYQLVAKHGTKWALRKSLTMDVALIAIP